jgi:hypothetical protein
LWVSTHLKHLFKFDSIEGFFYSLKLSQMIRSITMAYGYFKL